MSILTGVKLELNKLKHTGFWLFHILIICTVTILLDGYYLLYISRDSILRVKMIYEFVGILIPIMSSISIAFLVRLEEQISNMYGILAVRHRKNMIMGTLLVSWFVTMLQISLQTISLVILGKMRGGELRQTLLLGGGMIIFSLFYHIFHLFLHLKFGIGFSILWGVFECMQSVMYSNIQLVKIFRYIPSAWLMEWKVSVLEGNLKELSRFWMSSLFLLLVYLVLFLLWFEKWEGKKNYSE